MGEPLWKASTIVDQPFTVVDTWIGDTLETMTTPPMETSSELTWKWQPLTYGSSRHFVRHKRTLLFTVSVYTLSLERTEVVVDMDFLFPGFENVAREMLEMVTQNTRMRGDLESIEKLQTYLPVRIKPAARGPKEDSINRQARAALAGGEERKVVFRRWAREKKYNLSNEEDGQRADDAFRRMLSRKLKNRDVT